MPSSISSSRRLTAADRPGIAQPVPERDIPDRPWLAMLLGALLLAVALTGAWEWHWRAYGAVPGYDEDEALWAQQRRRIDAGEGNATVLVGASRTLFDLQLPVWERLSGRRPIQLAIPGTSPLPLLEDLANDQNFNGRVLIGIAPQVVFLGLQYGGNAFTYWRKESPSQRVGQWLSTHLVEPWLAFYDQDFALFTVLHRQPWPHRNGANEYIEVRKLSVSESDRNTYMWTKVATDPAYRAICRAVWAQNFNPPPPTPEEVADFQKTLDEQIARTAAAVVKLRTRGVPVIFVRHPSVDDYLSYENRVFPRATTWEQLLAKSGAPGVYFEDYPELRSGYEIPEWSHMTKESAERYTAALYGILERGFAPSDGKRW
ncbi:MAG TPA: hypothetical protein VF848_11110 [Steroidobacteraceae bacterium]